MVEIVRDHSQSHPPFHTGIASVDTPSKAVAPLQHADAALAAGPPFLALLEPALLLLALAPGLTPQATFEKLAAIQMLDVWLPTTDGRWLVMPRYTQPEPEQEILLHELKLRLPPQPAPRIKPRVDSDPKEAFRL